MEQDIMAERARVAREIHDGIAQQIAALGYELDALSTHPGVNPLARIETRRIRTDLSETLLDLRTRMHHLTHDPITLRDEIESLFAQLEIPTHLDIHEEQLPDGTGWQVSAIVHEAVRNIAQHSHATEAWCQYSASRQSVQIIIEDNGVGISSDQQVERRGITGMKERATLLGAKFQIENRLGGEPGCRVTLSLFRDFQGEQ
ncbi:MAG: histidine kinase [Actinobacteria bacterium]|jgi:signal transduction histidine kinase|nr:histidine kinase [Actinomycetota bacterium]